MAHGPGCAMPEVTFRVQALPDGRLRVTTSDEQSLGIRKTRAGALKLMRADDRYKAAKHVTVVHVRAAADNGGCE